MDRTTRRRQWAGSGRLPPHIRAWFTPGEQAVLNAIAAAHCRRGRSEMTVRALGEQAGLGATTVRNAIRQARLLGLVRVTERRQNRRFNLSNVVEIISPEWLAWLRLSASRPAPGPKPLGVRTPKANENRFFQRGLKEEKRAHPPSRPAVPVIRKSQREAPQESDARLEAALMALGRGVTGR